MVSRAPLRIVSDDELPAWKKKVRHKARPSTLVLGPPQAPRALTLGLSVRPMARLWPLWKVLVALLAGAIGLLVLTSVVVSAVRELAR